VDLILTPSPTVNYLAQYFGVPLHEIGLTPIARQRIIAALSAPVNDPMHATACALLPSLLPDLHLAHDLLTTLLEDGLRHISANGAAVAAGLARLPSAERVWAITALRQAIRDGSSSKLNNADGHQLPYAEQQRRNEIHARGLRAISLLGAMGTAAAPAVEDLQVLLASGDDGYCDAAVSSLGKIGPAAASAASELLRMGRGRAAMAFADDDVATATDASDKLVQMRRQGKQASLSVIISALGQIGNTAPPVIAFLREMVQGENMIGRIPDNVRMAALSALTHMGPAALPAFNAIAQQQDQVMARSALLRLLPYVTDAPFDPAFRDEYGDLPPIIGRSPSSSETTPE
ncbi:MAG TPA: hypothetical protein VKB76_20030, partial [Ktedonobacterales bacterium]|nr:hypothetical protein [Ktedonobacterales bacterium]